MPPPRSTAYEQRNSGQLYRRTVTWGLSIEGRTEILFDERVKAGISDADIVERATSRTLWIGLRDRPQG